MREQVIIKVREQSLDLLLQACTPSAYMNVIL